MPVLSCLCDGLGTVGQADEVPLERSGGGLVAASAACLPACLHPHESGAG